MNNREDLRKEIVEFLKAKDEKVMLITGTYLRQKHLEVLKVLCNNAKSKFSILFRINAKAGIDCVFEDIINRDKLKSIKLNEVIESDKLQLYIDTIDEKSWQDKKYNVSVLYPLETICPKKSETRKQIIDNLVDNTVNKVFLVTMHDNEDFSWVDELEIDRRAVFDAEEEDKELQDRVMKEIEKKK